MSTSTKTLTRIGAFVALLAVVFAASAFAGSRLDPEVEEDSPHTGGPAGSHGGSEAMDHGAHEDAGRPGADATLPGLAVAQGGYRLDLERTTLEPGAYRVFADFSTGGRSLTLGSDLFVPGQFEPRPLAAISTTADAGDGYKVKIDSAQATAGEMVPVTFEVTRNGRAVKDIEPYLGADGHLVVLREGDQAFLHAHPEGEPGGAGPIRFQVEYPSPGRYHLFLQFKHDGEVHAAAFTRAAAGLHPHTTGEES